MHALRCVCACPLKVGFNVCASVCMLEYVTVRLRADLLSPLGRFLQDHAHFPTPLRHISVPSAAWRGHSGRCAGPHRVSWSAACVHCACTPGQGRAWPCCYCMGTAAHTWKWAPVSGSPRELAGWGATLHRVTQTNHSQQAQCPNRLHTRAFTHIPSLTHTHTRTNIHTLHRHTQHRHTHTHHNIHTQHRHTHDTRAYYTYVHTRAQVVLGPADSWRQAVAQARHAATGLQHPGRSTAAALRSAAASAARGAAASGKLQAALAQLRGAAVAAYRCVRTCILCVCVRTWMNICASTRAHVRRVSCAGLHLATAFYAQPAALPFSRCFLSCHQPPMWRWHACCTHLHLQARGTVGRPQACAPTHLQTVCSCAQPNAPDPMCPCPPTRVQALGGVGRLLPGRRPAGAHAGGCLPHLQRHAPELAGDGGGGRRLWRPRWPRWRGRGAAAWGAWAAGHALHAACVPLVRSARAAAWRVPGGG